jgi:hypothetical protein
MRYRELLMSRNVVIFFFFICSLILCWAFNPSSTLAGRHGLSVAVTTCNINTGVAIGLDAGTCASPHATCNGVADDAPAFQAFRTWARATTTNTNGQMLELDVSGKCMFLSGSGSLTNNFTNGIKSLRIMGYGATLSNNNASDGTGFQFGGLGICHIGLSDPSGCSARIATASSGSSSVTLLNTSLCSRFTAGRWAVVTGFDLQGQFNSPYGFPPNPHYFDYVQISSTSNCNSTGQIIVAPALTNNYLSTWPNYNSGSSLEADAGGPATIYALDSSWDTQLDIRGITIDQVNNQTGAGGRSVYFQDIAVTGTACLIPSQNRSFIISNATMSGCTVEVDKLIDNYTLDNVTLYTVKTQSSSINTMTITRSNITNITGTPKVARISNSTIASLTVGPISYGSGNSASCTNCNITVSVGGTGYVESSNNGGANNYYTISSGVMSSPDGVNVTGIADNGSGLVRLTVTSTTGWTSSGAYTNVSNVFASGPNSNGAYNFTVIDGTHIDLLSTTFAGSVYTGAGQLQQSAPRWAVPGTNLFWAGVIAAEAVFQVTGVTQDASGTHIATSQTGGFPNIPISVGGLANLRIQQPKWTCSGCTGVADAVDFAGAPANTPMYSYSKRTYVNSSTLDQHLIIGKVTSIKYNVTQAYTGSTSPLTMQVVERGVVPAGTAQFHGPFIDLRTAGLRTVTPSGVTCDTGSGPVAGGCGADSGLTLPDPAIYFGDNTNYHMSSTPTDQPWQMSIEFIMDQGVVP